MILYIFRHGDTIHSKNSFKNVIHHFLHHHNISRDKVVLFSDTYNLPILPDGTHALEKIGNYLKNIKIDAAFCSPYLRCKESAKIVSKKSKIKFKIDNRLSEFEGKEHFNSLKSRVKDFLNDLDTKEYKSVAICTHGAVIAAIKHLKNEGKFNFFEVLDYPNPGVLTIMKDGVIKAKNFN